MTRANGPATASRRRRQDNEAADIEAFADHEVITPRRNLTRHARRVTTGPDLDLEAIARAEVAIADIAGEFADWMTDECERLADMRTAWVRQPNRATRDAFFRAAHDIRGQAETLGHPDAGRVADSLCRLLEGVAEPPRALVDRHVDAVRAIVREADRPDAAAIAAELASVLAERVAERLASAGSALARVDAPSLQMSGGD